MKTILAAIDFSDATNPVLSSAADLARACGARIVLVHILRPIMLVNEYSPVMERQNAAAEIEALKQLARRGASLQEGGFSVETRNLCGNPAICIREEAERREADYIVIGSHGHGALYELVIGSTASDLLKKAPCPVLVVPIAAQKPAPGGHRTVPATG